MRTPQTLTALDEVFVAFHHLYLEPPPPPATIGQGATATFRAAMARFSAGGLHAHRRAEVVALVQSVDVAVVRSTAFEITRSTLNGRISADVVADLAYRVPVETMLAALCVVEDPVSLLEDVGAIVEVIGRGIPATALSDAATIRLLQSCSVGRFNPITVASLLYQTFDATAALIIETILARHRHAVRAAAVTRTMRAATADVAIGEITLSAGDTVVLDLAATGLEFGAGTHECPGRLIAETIVDAVVNSIDLAGFAVVDISPTVEHHGLPTSIMIGAHS